MIAVKSMTCASCESSRMIEGVLMCRIADIPAIKVCRFFMYEPGTDEFFNAKPGEVLRCWPSATT